VPGTSEVHPEHRTLIGGELLNVPDMIGTPTSRRVREEQASVVGAIVS
jgi:hypothetical protein